MEQKKIHKIRDDCRLEMNEELKRNIEGRILFAYSGGADSTACLFFLEKECRLLGVGLDVFTIDTGCKGHITMQNILNCTKKILSCNSNSTFKIYDYKERKFYNDIISETFDAPRSMMEIYKQCYEDRVIPCGRLCNSIMDSLYMEILQEFNTSKLFTGGDSPKVNSQGKYTIFWKKQNGLYVVRVGAGFGITKKMVNNTIIENNIPWINPKCGGYDTDCLIPGAVFSSIFNGRESVSYSELQEKAPIIIEYLNEREEFGIYAPDEIQYCFKNLDISSSESFKELMDIFNNI